MPTKLGTATLIRAFGHLREGEDRAGAVVDVGFRIGELGTQYRQYPLNRDRSAEIRVNIIGLEDVHQIDRSVVEIIQEVGVLWEQSREAAVAGLLEGGVPDDQVAGVTDRVAQRVDQFGFLPVTVGEEFKMVALSLLVHGMA